MIFQFNNANTNATHKISFNDRISNYVEKYGINNLDNTSIIGIDFSSHWMRLPNKYVLCSYIQQNDLPKFINIANFSDKNWTQGVYNHNKSILLMKASDYKLLHLIGSIHIKGNEKYTAKILDVKKQGPYIHVVTDMQDASVFAYPAKISYELK